MSRDADLRQILKRARELSGLTREKFAKAAHLTSGHVANVENGHRRVTFEVISAYATALGAPLLAEVWEGDAMQRRSVIKALNLIGGVGVMASPDALISEALRLSLLRSFGGGDDWRDITEEIGQIFMTTPAHETHALLGRYLVMLGGQEDKPGAHDAAARMMLLRAATTANLGDLPNAFRWYRAARKIADESGDLRLITWVRGREATRRGYEGASPEDVIRLTTGLDCTEGHLARAQSFARIGERGSTIAALADAYRAYPKTDQSEGTVYGFQPWRFALCEAYVWALLGEVDRAQTEASAIDLSANLQRFVAQRELTHAVALNRVGARVEAQIAAQRVIDTHPTDQTSMILKTMFEEANA